MCYRAAQSNVKETYVRELRLDPAQIEFDIQVPRWNVAPGASVLALARDGGSRILRDFRWGLIPSWAENPETNVALANARSETVREKPSFRSAYKSRRCVIPVLAFYEWKKARSGKLPYAFHHESWRQLPLAGLWERWGHGERAILSATVITTAPNALMAPIHDRMPAILAPDEIDRWIDPAADPDELAALLRPYEGGDLRADRVSERVSSTRYNEPDCIAPIPEAPEPPTLF